MTEKEIRNYLLGMDIPLKDYEKLDAIVQRIYNDFESRICEKCNNVDGKFLEYFNALEERMTDGVK